MRSAYQEIDPAPPSETQSYEACAGPGHLTSNDILVIWKLERLARSMKQLIDRSFYQKEFERVSSINEAVVSESIVKTRLRQLVNVGLWQAVFMLCSEFEFGFCVYLSRTRSFAGFLDMVCDPGQ